MLFSELNTRPDCTPVNASPLPLPSGRITRGQGDWLLSSLYDSFIHYSPPAYADAPYSYSIVQWWAANKLSAAPEIKLGVTSVP